MSHNHWNSVIDCSLMHHITTYDLVQIKLTYKLGVHTCLTFRIEYIYKQFLLRSLIALTSTRIIGETFSSDEISTRSQRVLTQT